MIWLGINTHEHANILREYDYRIGMIVAPNATGDHHKFTNRILKTDCKFTKFYLYKD